MKAPFSKWLFAAGIYNGLWGLSVIVAPYWFFDFAGMERPLYPEIWQCVGMIVGVYGVGYLVAATDSNRHWPIVLVGLLGKIFGPIGFASALASGSFTPKAGLTILTNDLIWWIPFGVLLWRAFEANASTPHPEDVPQIEKGLEKFALESGESIAQASRTAPVVLVLARHLGCVFSRETLSDLVHSRDALKKIGARPLVVHSAEHSLASPVLQCVGWPEEDTIADPQTELYAAFGLRKGSFWDLFSPVVWVRGAKAWFGGHRVGKLTGDGFQMPGVFVIRDGAVIAEYRHKNAADRPDYVALAKGALKA